MTPWCCRTGGDQPQVWLVRSQSHARNYTVTLTRRAISPGKVGRPKRRRREGATACGLSLCTILVPCQIFFPSLFRIHRIFLLSAASLSSSQLHSLGRRNIGKGRGSRVLPPAFSWGSPFFSTSASFFWWDGQSFIATPVQKKREPPRHLTGRVVHLFLFFFPCFLTRSHHYNTLTHLLHRQPTRNGDESSHPALPAAAAGAALARHPDPPLAEHPRPLHLDREAHRAGEAGQVQPALARVEAQAQFPAQALRPCPDRG